MPWWGWLATWLTLSTAVSPLIGRWLGLIDPDPDCPGCHGDGTDPDGRRCDCTAPPGTFQGEWPE